MFRDTYNVIVNHVVCGETGGNHLDQAQYFWYLSFFVRIVKEKKYVAKKDHHRFYI